MGTTLALQNEELKRELARRDEELAHRAAKLIEFEELAKRLSRDNALLKDKLYRLMSRRYGPKADRFPEGQLELFEELFGEQEQEEPDRQALEAPDVELPDEPEPKKARRQKNRAREVDFRSLPREHRVHELSEEQRTCSVTGKLLVPVGTKAFEELCYQPAKLFVVEHELVEYGLSEEDRVERTAPTVTAPMPLRPIAKGLPSAGLLARILVAKYVEHRVPRRHAQQPKGRRSKPCCMEDEGRPLGIGVQAQVPNHLELRGSRARVVSVEGNGVARPRQVRSKKTSASEPLMTCREVSTRRRNRAGCLARDEPRGNLHTGWAASGMKAA